MKSTTQKPSDSRQELINALDQIITICFEIENRIDSLDDEFYMPVCLGRRDILKQAISAKSRLSDTCSACLSLEDLSSTDNDLIDIFSTSIKIKLILKQPGNRKALRLYYAFAEMVKACLDAEMHLTALLNSLKGE